MESSSEESHRNQSPYLLEISEAGSAASTGRSVRTLREWCDQIVTGGGSLVDPVGKRHRVELTEWEDLDPNRVKLAIGFVLPADFDRFAGDDVVPGSVYAEVREFDPADKRFVWDDLAGTARPIGATLRALRLALGGDEGTVTDPDGNAHSVSLHQWSRADADTTWLYVVFFHQQRSAPYGFHGSRGDARWHHQAMDRLPPPTQIR